MNQYFPDTIKNSIVPMKYWRVKHPEKYALLANLVNLTAEELFGPQLSSDEPIVKLLHQYKNSDKTYTKTQLANILGIASRDLINIAEKYGIEPFWTERGVKKKYTESISVQLTLEEKNTIIKAAKKAGFSSLSSYGRYALLNDAKTYNEKL